MDGKYSSYQVLDGHDCTTWETPGRWSLMVWDPMTCLHDDIYVFELCSIFKCPSFISATLDLKHVCKFFDRHEVEANPSPWRWSGLRDEKNEVEVS